MNRPTQNKQIDVHMYKYFGTGGGNMFRILMATEEEEGEEEEEEEEMYTSLRETQKRSIVQLNGPRSAMDGPSVLGANGWPSSTPPPPPPPPPMTMTAHTDT